MPTVISLLPVTTQGWLLCVFELSPLAAIRALSSLIAASVKGAELDAQTLLASLLPFCMGGHLPIYCEFAANKFFLYIQHFNKGSFNYNDGK